MKKILAITLVAMVAAAVQADTIIYEEDFDSGVAFKAAGGDPIYYPADFSDGEWITPGDATVAIDTSSRLYIQTDADEAARAVSVVIDAGDFIGVGTYKLTFDIALLRNLSSFDVEIWEIVGGTGLGTRVDPQTALPLEPFWTTGTGTAKRLTENQYAHDEEATGLTVDFPYNGSSDIALLFSLEAGTSGTAQRAVFDNVSITTAIPEPATLGLLGAFGGALLFIRRKFRI